MANSTSKEYRRKWRRANIGKVLDYERNYRKRADPAVKLVGTARRRARRDNIDFNLDRSDIVIPEYCPIFNIKLHAYRGQGRGPRDASPTIDRVDNTKGYIKGNVCVISHRANRCKNDMSLEDVKALLAYMEAHLGKENLTDH